MQLRQTKPVGLGRRLSRWQQPQLADAKSFVALNGWRSRLAHLESAALPNCNGDELLFLKDGDELTPLGEALEEAEWLRSQSASSA